MYIVLTFPVFQYASYAVFEQNSGHDAWGEMTWTT